MRRISGDQDHIGLHGHFQERQVIEVGQLAGQRPRRHRLPVGLWERQQVDDILGREAGVRLRRRFALLGHHAVGVGQPGFALKLRLGSESLKL
jgi:hypothetical protein